MRPETLLLLVPGLPLVGFLLLALGGRRLDGGRAAVVGAAAVGLAFLAAAAAATAARSSGGTVDVHLYEWIHAGRPEVALTVATAELEKLVPVERATVGRVWWPTDLAVESLLGRMWDPDAAAGVRPIQANIPAGDVLTNINLPAAPVLVTGEAPRRAPMSVDVALHLDPLSILMILLVTGVGFLIHLYSAGYMANDEGLRRYFAYLNLFTFSMLLLVLADDFLVMFVGWELVGLCSYLLIGFWYSDVANASAGRKAFLLNRVGDFAFVIGLMAIWSTFGSLAFDNVLSAAPTALVTGGGLATGIALCLLIGATGKSAQIPLFVWLPDAMAGPTPVSALIHAATMVTAGVYMIARAHTLFASAPLVLDIVGVIGAATALLGALIAVVQVDIKKVLAYSTVSQLGYMFLALGAGAFAAAVFHLMAHAFFKALLFLGAGSVMHAMEHGFHHAPPDARVAEDDAPAEDLAGRAAGGLPVPAPLNVFADIPNHQDMRLMGGLAPRVRWTAGTFAIGSLALAGLFPLVGFWSKDEILHQVFMRGGSLWQLLYVVALATAGVTAYYAGRMLLLTFAGPPRSVGAEYAQESPPVMVAPLVALAVLTVAGGLAALPTHGGTWLTNFLEPALGPSHEGDGASKLILAGVALAVSIAGLALAWQRFGRRGEAHPSAAGVAAPSAFQRAAAGGFFIDRAYLAIFAAPFRRLADWLWRTADDIAIDGSVNAVGRLMVSGGQVLRRTQTGYTRGYALSLLAGVALLAAYFVYAARP